MEYVLLPLSQMLEVVIDGQIAGRAGQVLMVEEGTHRFVLPEVGYYEPFSQVIVVTNTSPLRPLLVGRGGELE